MDQDRIELGAQPHRPHVPHVMFHLGVEPAGVLDHASGQVHRRRAKVACEMGEVVPTAGTQLQDPMAAGAQVVPDGPTPMLCFLGVILGWTDDRPQIRQVVVEAHGGGSVARLPGPGRHALRPSIWR